MIQEFFNAIRDYTTAFRLLSKRSLWHWQIVPGIISLLLGSVIFGLAYQFGDNLGSILSSWYPWSFGKTTIVWIFKIMGKIFILFSGLFMYRYILLMVISPILSLLSEKVERIYLEEPIQAASGFIISRLFRDIRRSIYLTTRNLFRELFLTLGLFLASFIPGMSIFTGPLTIGVQSYYAGFGNMDFTMERYMNTKERIRFVKANKGLAIGNGLLFIAILMIPIIGLFFAPTLGVIAATIGVLDEMEID